MRPAGLPSTGEQQRRVDAEETPRTMTLGLSHQCLATRVRSGARTRRRREPVVRSEGGNRRRQKRARHGRCERAYGSHHLLAPAADLPEALHLAAGGPGAVGAVARRARVRAALLAFPGGPRDLDGRPRQVSVAGRDGRVSRPRARRPSSGRARSCRVRAGRRGRRTRHHGRGRPPRRSPRLAGRGAAGPATGSRLAFETRPEPIRMYRKRSFATRR